MAIGDYRLQVASQARSPVSLMLFCTFSILPAVVIGKKRLRGGCTKGDIQPGDVPEIIEYALIEYDEFLNAQEICSCVPSIAFDQFAKQSKNAVMTMIKQTPEAMRHGLEEFGRATAELAEHGEDKCDKSVNAFNILKEIGWKLQPSNGPEQDFQYEHMQSLKLNGRDIYIEMNDFLLKFFSPSKGDKVGLALSRLFDALLMKPRSDEEDDNSEVAVESNVNGEQIHT